jgi:hypothetical protein
MSLLSQGTWGAAFTFAAVASFAAALGQNWPTRVTLPVLCPLFIAMFAMAWYDNKRSKG